MAKLVPLFSGSQGNSYYLGSGGSGILIDAGRSAKQLTEALKSNDVDIASIKAIFVTHEHSDHVKGVRVLANRHSIPVYSSLGTQREMLRQNFADEKTDLRLIDGKGVDIGDMHIDRFPISHDCAEGCGYRVDMGNARFALATDLGCLDDFVKTALYGCDAVVIESNHDVRMLQMGPYPYYLKRRILSAKGHLSNEVCSEFLPELVRRGTKRFLLAHLSKENNMPDIAYNESVNELNNQGMRNGVDYTLGVAPVATDGKSLLF